MYTPSNRISFKSLRRFANKTQKMLKTTYNKTTAKYSGTCNSTSSPPSAATHLSSVKAHTMKSKKNRFPFFIKIFTLSLLIWTYRHADEPNCGKSFHKAHNEGNTVKGTLGRSLSNVDSLLQQDYKTLKKRYNESLKDYDRTHQNKSNTLFFDDDLEYMFDLIKNDDNIQKTLDALKHNKKVEKRFNTLDHGRNLNKRDELFSQNDAFDKKAGALYRAGNDKRSYTTSDYTGNSKRGHASPAYDSHYDRKPSKGNYTDSLERRNSSYNYSDNFENEFETHDYDKHFKKVYDTFKFGQNFQKGYNAERAYDNAPEMLNTLEEKGYAKKESTRLNDHHKLEKRFNTFEFYDKLEEKPKAKSCYYYCEKLLDELKHDRNFQQLLDVLEYDDNFDKLLNILKSDARVEEIFDSLKRNNAVKKILYMLKHDDNTSWKENKTPARKRKYKNKLSKNPRSIVSTICKFLKNIDAKIEQEILNSFESSPAHKYSIFESNNKQKNMIKKILKKLKVFSPVLLSAIIIAIVVVYKISAAVFSLSGISFIILIYILLKYRKCSRLWNYIKERKDDPNTLHYYDSKINF